MNTHPYLRAYMAGIVVPTALTRGGTFAGAHRILGGVGEILRVL